MNAYSNKIHELHLRVCSEIENIIKIVIHKHFVSANEVKMLWDSDKSKFLEKKALVTKYEELRNELNKSEKGKLDKFLFGFPDFLFYFKIACEKFNLHKKVIKFTGMVSHNLDWEVIQPFELDEGRDVPIWWTNYNKLKHDKIKNFDVCTLGDLVHSFSGLFILMNYLLKYRENNSPIENVNFETERLRKQNPSVTKIKFCTLKSRFFEASNAYQHILFSILLPDMVSEKQFQETTILQLETTMMGEKFQMLENWENLSLKEINFRSFDYKWIGNNDEIDSISQYIYYSYLDYIKTVSLDSINEFRELRHFAQFIN